jgi:single-stranded-DNA-specific exonuclease
MLTKAKIKEILSNRIEELSASNLPHFLLLNDIQKAAKRIVKAIQNNEKIVVVGDYDVDGVSSSAIMKLFFEKIGFDIEIVIPDRFEDGYGLSLKLLERIEADDKHLLGRLKNSRKRWLHRKGYEELWI